MADLTADQLADFRQDIDDNGTPSAFSDAQLQRLFARETEDYNRSILRAIDQLLMSSSRFADYTRNETQERKNQIFQNLLKLREIWQNRVDTESSSAPSTTRIVGIRVQRKDKDYPADGHDYRRSNASHLELDGYPDIDG